MQEKERAWTARDGRARLFENAEKESDVRVAPGVWQVQPGIGESASQPHGILRHGVRSAPREVAEVPFPDLFLCRFLLLLKISAKVPTRDDESSRKGTSTPQRDAVHPPDRRRRRR